jgi:hypothetical protein
VLDAVRHPTTRWGTMRCSSTRAVAVLAAAVLGLTACGGGSTPIPSVAGGGSEAAVPRCDELRPVELPAEHLRDAPIYVANEQPVDDLRAWASTLPGFEELWIDRDHLGWVVLAFSQDAASRQAELTERFPEVGAVVLPVDWTMEELDALQRRISGDLGHPNGSDVRTGVVQIDVPVLTDAVHREVAASFAGERVCISGRDPDTEPAPGPQQAGGDGWRLLVDELGGDTYRTGIAADEEGYERLWDEIGLPLPRPAVDFDTEVVIWFGAVFSSSCPDIRLDGVVVDEDARLVHAQIVDVVRAEACTDDANPRAFVVALERARLPDGPFRIQLRREDPYPGTPAERTVVDADLRQPGAPLAPGHARPDPAIAEPPTHVVGDGDIIEAGYPVGYRFHLHCGPEWLGPLNDVLWRSETTDTPPGWRSMLDADEALVVEVLLEVDPPTLTATADGHAIVYRPTAEEHPGCD